MDAPERFELFVRYQAFKVRCTYTEPHCRHSAECKQTKRPLSIALRNLRAERDAAAADVRGVVGGGGK